MTHKRPAFRPTLHPIMLPPSPRRLLAYDRLPLVMARPRPLAMDRAPTDRASTVRSATADGYLRVSTSPISKAAVNPYRGDEIPDGQSLRLDPTRVYRMLRDPGELSRAAATFDVLPVLSRHAYVNATNFEHRLVVGTTGTDTVYRDPYLFNSLVFWDAAAIAGIEHGVQRELSAAYHYRADMTPGTWRGEPYDGVMRDMQGNHVALVQSGRAGNDVLVMDGAMTMPNSDDFTNLYTFLTDRLSPEDLVEATALIEAVLEVTDPTDPNNVAMDSAFARATRDSAAMDQAFAAARQGTKANGAAARAKVSGQRSASRPGVMPHKAAATPPLEQRFPNINRVRVV
jgi:hypothetical protein